MSASCLLGTAQAAVFRNVAFAEAAKERSLGRGHPGLGWVRSPMASVLKDRRGDPGKGARMKAGAERGHSRGRHKPPGARVQEGPPRGSRGSSPPRFDRWLWTKGVYFSCFKSPRLWPFDLEN